jgi:hypothetical protein
MGDPLGDEVPGGTDKTVLPSYEAAAADVRGPPPQIP